MVTTPSDRALEFFTGWLNLVTIGVIAGMVVIGLHGIVSGPPGALFAGIALAGACLLAGALLGFLFGIPRSLQADGTAPAQEALPAAFAKDTRESPRYKANTNLEQISDWLTKILVGVGLTQLTSVPRLFQQTGQQFGSSIAVGNAGNLMVGSIIVYFAIVGFMGGYLWTRLFLGSALARADLEALNQRFDEIESAQRQTQLDAKALSMVSAFLAADAPATDIPALKAALRAASPSIRMQAFYQARDVRRKGGPGLKGAIPIFRALAESDADRRYHKNFGQLGYAHMELNPPDYKGAIDAFTEAIRIRGNMQRNGFPAYEFCRAACTIRDDLAFQSGKPTDKALAKTLRDELNAARAQDRELKADDVDEWLKLNPP
jgi:hypothetical protein